jgi:hypothetical protein
MLVGFLHFIFFLFISIYGFAFKKNKFDYFYILLNMLIFLSWTFFEGECYISYYEKKKKNKDYVAGSNNQNVDDMFLWLGPEYEDIFYVLVRVLSIFGYISIYLVLKRNDYPNYIIYSYILMYLLYYVYLRIPNISSFYQNFFKVYLIGLIIYILREPRFPHTPSLK